MMVVDINGRGFGARSVPEVRIYALYIYIYIYIYTHSVYIFTIYTVCVLCMHACMFECNLMYGRLINVIRKVRYS